MYGVAASMIRRGVGGGEAPWLPVGAIAYLDFVEGHYYAGGTVQPVSLLLGNGFDPSAIGPNGMATWYTNSNRPAAIGDLLTDFAAAVAGGFTVVVEFSWVSAYTSDAPLLMFFNDADADAATWILYFEKDTAPNDGFLGDSDTLFVQDDFPEFVTNGVNRFAATYGRDLGGGSWRYALSVNGSTAVTQDLAYSVDANFGTTGLVRVAVGAVDEWFWAFDDGYIRKIEVYPVTNEADLPALSSLPTA